MSERLPTVTSGDRDATQPQARDQAEHTSPKATNRVKSGEAGKPRQLWGRPELYTSYAQSTRMLNTRPKLFGVLALIALAVYLPFGVEDQYLHIGALAFAAAVGAIGLNLVTGFAGQVSLGHAFFLAVGAYTAAALSGDPDGRTLGFGITFLPVWLLAAGLVAGVIGIIVAPIATRLRGLYLAIVTLGLVFLGEHIFKEWQDLTGGPGVGRAGPVPDLFGNRLNESGDVLTADQKLYLTMLVLLIIFAIFAKNLVRSKVGRAFSAVRDRDIAAEIIGVSLTRYKVIAFGVSSFYAGCAGAMVYTVVGFFDPTSFTLVLSINYVAMVLIGGAGTISGSIMGAIFITALPRLTQELPTVVPFISTDPTASVNTLNAAVVLYGLLIIVFLIFEPRGLFGIWLRIRNYFKAWPFSY